MLLNKCCNLYSVFKIQIANSGVMDKRKLTISFYKTLSINDVYKSKKMLNMFFINRVPFGIIFYYKKVK